MRNKVFIIIFSLIAMIPSTLFGILQPKSTRPVALYSHHTQVPQRIASIPTTAQKHFIQTNPKAITRARHINANRPIQKVSLMPTKKTAQQDNIQPRSTKPATQHSYRIKSPQRTIVRPTPAQKHFMKTITRARPIKKSLTPTKKPIEQNKKIEPTHKASSLDLTSHKKPSIPQLNIRTKEVNNTGRGVAVSKVNEKFTDHMNTRLFKFIKKSMTLSMKNPIAQITWAEMIGESIEHLFHQLMGIHKPGKSIKNNSINNFKMQIQYLAQQIYSYNDVSTYTKPEEMLLLIKFINQFLKENNAILFSPVMLAKLDAISEFATFNCDQFKNKNMIFSSTNAPKEILSHFKQPIINTNNLSKIKFSRALMHEIYDTDGYMDQIMQTWKTFKANELSANTVNRQYASFLAFLLLFENSLVAAAIILDETSKLYKVTNPVPVVINIT